MASLAFLRMTFSSNAIIRAVKKCCVDPVNYMDLKINIDSDNKLTHELFLKPSDGGVSLNFESCVPRHQKTSVATQHFRRAAALSSNPTARQRSEDKIEALLQKNGFPSLEIKFTRENQQPASSTNEANSSSESVKLYLPFCSNNLDKQVRRIVRKSNLPVRVVYGQAPNLKQRLVRSALLPSGCIIHDKFVEEQRQSKRRPGRPREDCISCRARLKETHCDRQFAVYSLTCTVCSKEYIGETQRSRSIRARVQEHFTEKTHRGESTCCRFTRTSTAQKKRHPSSRPRFSHLKKTSFEEKQGKPSKLGTRGLKSIATVAGN